MSTLRFTKIQGAGNDFVILDEQTDLVKAHDLAIELCLRHTGIGADGVIWLAPESPQRARVVFFNADGSRPEVCGNGLRCAAHYLHQRSGMAQELLLESDAGVRACRIQSCAGQQAQVEVEMGQVLALDVGDALLRRHRLAQLGDDVEVYALSVGNPHLVILQAAERETVLTKGPEFSQLAALPDGANVEWVERLGPDHIRIEVFERGVGRTLACGSGACAAVAALVSGGHLAAGQACRVDLPGGQLSVHVDADDTARLLGPSRLVFDGQIDWPTD